MNNIIRTLFSTILILSFVISISGQNLDIQPNQSNIALQEKMDYFVPDDKATAVDQFFNKYAAEMGLSSSAEMRFLKTIPGRNGHQHFRYEQVYQSIPVFGSAYTLHEKNGSVISATGHYLPIINIETNPVITEAEAINIARDEMFTASSKLPNNQLTDGPTLSEEVTTQLYIIDTAFPKSSGNYALAYSVVVTSIHPYDIKEYFVDANNGGILLELPKLAHNAVPAVGETKYYGEQMITVDSIAPDKFLLQDPTRNNNSVLNADQEIWSNDENSWNLGNEEQDEVAIDLHFCTQEFHDYLLEKFEWNGLDNNGFPMNGMIHAGAYVNASWNGSIARFGDGDCHNGPLTTLEVVAHEYTHGITGFGPGLVYSSESGAINESMSDVFGKALEHHVDPDNSDWDIGASFLTTQYDESFRSFVDPNSKGHPKFYKGELWNDNGGVHTNSSVGNHFFYNLVNGGQGINEAGEPYNVTGIGMDRAIQIIFLTLTVYLQSDSDYNEYYNRSLLAAAEIYGDASQEYISVQEAWKVVGLPFVPDEEEILQLAVEFQNNFRTCLDNEFINLEIEVTNTGTITYETWMNGVLEITNNADDILEIPLTFLSPNTTRTYYVDDFVFMDKDTTRSLSATLKIDDELHANDNLFFRNKVNPENDLELVSVSIPNIECFNPKFNVEFEIKNNSCENLAGGTEFEIRLFKQSTNSVVTIPFKLDQFLFSNATETFSGELGLSIDGSYEVTLEYQYDVNNSNNTIEFNVPPGLATITGPYYNNFDKENEFLAVTGEYIEIRTADTKNVLAISNDAPFDFFTLCPDPADNFEIENFYFKKHQLSFCVDLENVASPELSFDLTQYRRDGNTDFPELNELSTAARYSWTSEDENFSETIYNQTEGEMVRHRANLPDKFKGKISLDFFHKIGDFYEDDYLDYDATLLDNLMINGNLLTSDKGLSVNIFPNPSEGIYNLTHSAQPQSIKLYSIHGQFIFEKTSEQQMSQLDLSYLINGYYVLVIDYGELGQLTEPIVKIE